MGKNAVGLILAAGFSSRMGAFKPLLPIGDTTAAERIAETYRKADVEMNIGVTGYQRELLEPVFRAVGVREAYNPDFEQGMFTSIKTGIRSALNLPAAEAETVSASAENHGNAQKKPEGFFLMLVDCPLVPPRILDRIWEKHLEEPDAFIVPCCRGKKGHPLFIPISYAEEILSYDGDGGLKAITNRHEDRMIRLETGNEAVVLDMDTPEGYEEVLEFWRKHESAACLEEPKAKGSGSVGPGTEEQEWTNPDWGAKLAGRRVLLVRHGEICQHKEKIFLGQTDVPLSDLGKEQAAAAADELIRIGVAADRIYASDLSRTAETATIIADRLQNVNGIIEQELTEKVTPPNGIILMPRLREMSLGEWDGRFISEIKEQYPEEYRKRGENLLTYKYGNESENYYDLQYRVMKGFEDIMRLERERGNDSGDIVIVAHSGVIAVLRSNLLDMKLEEEINCRVPNGGISEIDLTKKKEIR